MDPWKKQNAIWEDPKAAAPFMPKLFQPKGQMDIDTMVLQSVVGPLGQPADQAMYPGVATSDGKPMNARNDYVIRMTKDELPPAKAFWSATLYDTKQGFFIPNEQKKYSVGQNAGMKLNASGGIEIHVAAKQPKGVPAENWLPITREDLGIDRKVSRRPSSTLASAAGRMPAFFVANSNCGNSPGIAHVRIPRSTPVESTFRCRRRGTA